MSVSAIAVRMLFTLCLLALIALASLMPLRPDHAASVPGKLLGMTPAPLQKLLHVLLYALLALLLTWSLEAVPSWPYRLPVAFTVCVVFGAVMEWCQMRVPGRFGRLSDVALDAAGAGIGLLAAVLLL